MLGDREFCSLDLATSLQTRNVRCCLSFKKTIFIEVKNKILQRLDELPIKPGVALYYQGNKIGKIGHFQDFVVAAKWKINYRNQNTK
ncbi:MULTISPECIES: hypothetical protein [unclassified Microcoleus]|uniref:hypothetical protein n=1 Tax=unclassified Microcoleus TaxID=2642155 RepID=UPI002FD5D841